MEDFEMADALAWFLNNEDKWTAEYAGLDEINFTNEDGDKYVIRVERVDAFPSDEAA